MAAPMRDSPLDGGHRAKVADATRTTTATKPESATSNNFEYDDNEWDIGIGDLIIDLDADIEKTNEIAATTANNHMASTAGGGGSGGGQQTAGGQANKAGSGAAKMAIEHSATVDKGLKMKIKRTKPGTKTSEAKHEIVKSANELNGTASSTAADVVQGGGGGGDPKTGGGGKHAASGTAANNAGGNNQQGNSASGGAGANSNSSKRGSSGHRRDKARDKHVSDNKPAGAPSAGGKPVQGSTTGGSVQQSAAGVQPDVNGVVVQRGTVSGGGGPVQPQQPPPRAVFPASTGPGPPPPGSAPGPPQSPAAATAAGSASKPEQTKVAAVVLMPSPAPAPSLADDRTSSPPPAKKMKTSNDPKETADVCIGTSVGTITEPDCLGPCEPGTSVTLEGIVWHETEGGVLVVNVTWRGKTYVGTLLDCTRHDWAPPRFCDSPTSDLDARTPKGRGKRGRAAAASTPGNDLSNFTETRSSVHSKLRNGGAKGRRGGANGNGNGNNAASTGTASPTPFIPPRPEPSNKRKSRVGDEDIPTPAGKKSRIPATVPASPVSTTSPPASPILLECPEPNCSKKYKHINGLKYHQSHAHGSVDDDDTKDVTSMSENDESNIEAPSPATPVKSPEKIGDTPSTPQKKDEAQSNSIPNTPLSSVGLIVPDVSSQPSTPKSRPASPPTPQSSILSQPPPEIIPSVAPPPVDSKSIVKPGVLRFGPGPTEDFTFANKPPMSTPVASGTSNLTAIRTVGVTSASNQPVQAESSPLQPTVFQNQSSPLQPNPLSQQIPSHHPMTHQPPLSMPPQHPQSQPNHPQNMQSPQGQNNKIPQFKVKPTAALMPDDKKDRNKPPGYKKKNRKSPAGSPHPQPELPTFGTEQGGREDVQSPAYSDISDDTAPVLESEVSDKNKTPVDKKTEPGPPIPHSIPQYGMYPFYGQPPYLVPSVQQPPQTLDGKTKEGDKGPEKLGDKEGKKEGPEFQQKVLPQHYFSYGYMQGYQYNIESQYGPVSMVPDDKIKEERLKENPSPAEHGNKQATPIPNPIQVPTPAKVKSEPGMKEKHQNENHQILKESIEMKSQMNPFIYSRQQQQQVQQQQQAQQNHHHHAQQQAHHQQQQQQQAHQHQQQQAHQQQQVHQQQQQQAHQQQQAQQQREEDIRRYYLYPDQQRRKDNTPNVDQSQKTSGTPKAPPQPNANVKHKDKPSEEKKEKETKQEGVKPTMETQGPPPPPTSQYYIHPSYMQSPHYGTLPFDPNHPMYRSMIVPGPYGGAPYLHPQIPRYHAPEDLSRGPQPQTKALDILQHHANQYYTSHKIHELQERAMKSPTPKTSAASASPSNAGQVSQPPQGNPQGPPVSQGPGGPGSGPPQGGKQTPGDGKDSRSPPPQRHVHTHHHTHVGLGYPILAGQYPAPYGAAAVLASQQAAAVTVINPYPPK